jgi:SAM-dependent methyltransferase
MDARTTTSELEFLRRNWDERARGPRADAAYYRSGEDDVERDIAPHLARGGAALEIGCGAGRMTRALSRLFDTVFAVDISAGMVSLARDALRDCPNVRVFQNDGRSLDMVRGPIDFAVAYGVFPHLSRAWVESYSNEVRRLLRPGGVFLFEVLAEFDLENLGYEVVRRETAGRPYDLVWSIPSNVTTPTEPRL